MAGDPPPGPTVTKGTLDLTAERPPSKPLEQLQPNVEQNREGTRRRIAYILLFLVAVLVAVASASVFAEGVQLQRVKDILGLVFGPMVGLMGAVVGFYFGAQTAIQSGSDGKSDG